MRYIKHTFAFFLALSLLLACGTAGAVWEEFPDGEGHWAQETLQRAVCDGLLMGADGRLLPDEPITRAQMLTILCRVLGPTAVSALDGVTDVPESAWYRETAEKALGLGLAAPENGMLRMNAPMSRRAVFTMLCEAFQLERAEPDAALLSAWPDCASLSASEQGPIASLAELGLIEGYGGALHPDSPITRAEFLTILYRAAENHIPAAEWSPELSGGAVLSGEVSLENCIFADGVWLGCSSNRVCLYDITAPAVTLRAETLETFSLRGCKIDRLTLASRGADISVTGRAGEIGTLVAGDGSGLVTVSGGVRRIEVTGADREVVISGETDTLVVSGSGNTISVLPGARVENLVVLKGAERTRIMVDGRVSNLTVSGRESAIGGSGRALNALVTTAFCDFTLSASLFTDSADHGLAGVSISLSAPESTNASEAFMCEVSAAGVTAGKACTAEWYLDGQLVRTDAVCLAADMPIQAELEIPLRLDMPERSSITLVLQYTTDENERQSVRAETVVSVTKPDAETIRELEHTRVLSLVQTGYAGDYTTQWALDNDYSAYDKTLWVNAKGYQSDTRYLIWVSLRYQRVNIFEGEAGSWTLLHEYLCGSGAPGMGTPVGVYRTTFTQPGWYTPGYDVRPVVRFKNPPAYAFHSRLYYPGTDTFKDASIGYPVSHGCLRMYTEDVTWMYENIPQNTTVVVF